MQTLKPKPQDGIAALFDRLDAWRHFPAYQLERRADIFFSLYLREVIEGERQVELAEAVIPEVPIKHAHSAQSFKADYLCSADHLAVYLVELKTDLRSRRSEQDVYLAQAAKARIAALMQGICDIILATNHRRKYFHLLNELSKLGLLELPLDLENQMFSKSKTNLVRLLRAITLTEAQPKLEVVYIQPLPRRDSGPHRLRTLRQVRGSALRPAEPAVQRKSAAMANGCWRTRGHTRARQGRAVARYFLRARSLKLGRPVRVRTSADVLPI